MQKGKLRILNDGTHIWYCPACDTHHGGPINNSGPVSWDFDGDYENPTFSPSFLVRMPRADKVNVCHTFVRNGEIQYLSDCTHEMAGKTVKMIDIESGD